MTRPSARSLASSTCPVTLATLESHGLAVVHRDELPADPECRDCDGCGWYPDTAAADGVTPCPCRERRHRGEAT